MIECDYDHEPNERKPQQQINTADLPRDYDKNIWVIAWDSLMISGYGFMVSDYLTTLNHCKMLNYQVDTALGIEPFHYPIRKPVSEESNEETNDD